MTELPRGWEEVLLGHLALIIRGVTYKKHEALTDPAEGYVPLIRATNIGRSLDFDDLYFVPAARVSDDRRLRRGDVVVASSSGSASVVGKSAQLKSDWSGTFGGFCAAVRPNRQLSASYLGLFLQSDDLRRRWSNLARGSNINNLRVEHLADTPVPFPPAAEQERIVVAIEEAFSKLDAGEAGLRAVHQLLKRMRAAVLAAAVTGRLVPQDPTDTPAAKLLADLRVEPIDLAEPALPHGWAWATIESISAPQRNALAIGPFGSNLKVVDYASEGVPLVFVRNIRRCEFRAGRRFVSQTKANELTSHWVRRGDVLVTKMGDPPGDTAVYPEQEAAIITADCIKVTCGSAVVPEYLAQAIAGGETRRRLLEVTRGVAQKKVSLARFKVLPVAIPPIQEQQRIVAEVDRQFSFLAAGERAVEAGIVRSAALRRSVLKSAFEGNLVPQDPSDEPASVLLERIRGERAAAPTPARRTRRSA